MLKKSQNHQFTINDQAILRAGISELPTLQRRLLIYRFWGNCTIEEIAQRFQMSWVEVDKLMDKAIESLGDFCLRSEDFSLSNKQGYEVMRRVPLTEGLCSNC